MFTNTFNKNKEERYSSVKLTELEKTLEHGGITHGKTFFYDIVETEDFFKIYVICEEQTQLSFCLRSFGKFDDPTVGNFTEGDVYNWLASRECFEETVAFYKEYVLPPISTARLASFEGRSF